MPGPVIEGHADLEDDCRNCHRPFRAEEQRALCLECHEEVAADVAGETGFHGKSRARTVECKLCHTEHVGRDGEIVRLDSETFDHDLTDFPLENRHRTIDCSGCHDSAKPYRETGADCIDCHRDDDAHAGQMGEDCGDCHRTDGWRRSAEFDHDQTRFSLEGKHARVPCASCHPDGQDRAYDSAPTNCYACHRIRDVHRGRFSDSCERCHSPSSWERVHFRHERDTGFPLRGRHQKVSCEACHQENPYKSPPGKNCVACHRADDHHKGRFGASCDQCHSVEDWKAERFDHGETDFPLHGRHSEVPCVSCHTEVVGEEALDTRCHHCHADADVHQGQLGTDCAACHVETGWRRDVRFDHDLTRFPLLGLHAVVPCEACHASARFADSPSDCRACHASDDYHESSLGPDCERCHNPNGWEFWRFDHDLQTEFSLEGAHSEQSCAACHRKPVEEEVEQSRECGSCHDSDDIHLGRYGRDCGRCHTSSSWRELRLLR